MTDPDVTEAGIPNLDCEDRDELKARAAVFNDLARYADTKGNAMYFRSIGHIHTAMRCEAECDAIFRTLPAWARW